MTTTNAKITSVNMGFDDWGRLTVTIVLQGQAGGYAHDFVMGNPVSVQKLCQLMTYTGSNHLHDLKGKIIRIVDSDDFLRGFGHPIEDRFVPTTSKEFTEVSEAEFARILASK